MLTCATRPCASCPYRTDAPSGLWSAEHYDMLPIYDGTIQEQLLKGALGVFLCHQKDGQLCAGWVAAHGTDNLLALRLDKDVAEEVFGYQTDVPVFRSGAEAREHGLRDIEAPGSRARRLMGKMVEKGIARYDGDGHSQPD